MKCFSCGHKALEPFQYCPKCGAGPQAEELPKNEAALRILAMLKDDCYLILCVLISLSCGLSVLSGIFPLLQILATIFMWGVYIKSKKDIVDAGNLRCISGTVYAKYVLNWLLTLAVLITGIVVALTFRVLADSETIRNFLTDLIAKMNIHIDVRPIFEVSGIVVFAYFAAFASILAVMNVLFIGRIHRCTRALHNAARTGKLKSRKVRGARIFLLILGICLAAGILEITINVFAALDSLVSGICCFLGWYLLGKYFPEEEEDFEPEEPEEELEEDTEEPAEEE